MLVSCTDTRDNVTRIGGNIEGIRWQLFRDAIYR